MVALAVCCTVKVGLLGAIVFGGSSIAGLGLGTGMTPVVLLGGVVLLAGLTCLGLHRMVHSRESDDHPSTEQTATGDALEALDGVTSATADHDTETATIEGTAHSDVLTTAVEESGYEAADTEA